MSSVRLPGKVLADVGGAPMLALLLRRLGAARSVDRIVVATSTDPGDEPIDAVAADLGVETHRGPLDDVLTRLADAARGHDGTVVRITADCPFIDPALVDATVELLEASGCAYASNVEPRTYPDGLDVEAMPAHVLAALAAEPLDASDREHVTTALRRDPSRWSRVGLAGGEDLADLRWTVDTEDDLEFVRQVAARLGDRRYEAGLEVVRAAVLEDPSLASFGGARRG
jgi:spore coat polysaccharide biosynthesis protein SpsF